MGKNPPIFRIFIAAQQESRGVVGQLSPCHVKRQQLSGGHTGHDAESRQGAREVGSFDWKRTNEWTVLLGFAVISSIHDSRLFLRRRSQRQQVLPSGAFPSTSNRFRDSVRIRSMVPSNLLATRFSNSLPMKGRLFSKNHLTLLQ